MCDSDSGKEIIIIPDDKSPSDNLRLEARLNRVNLDYGFLDPRVALAAILLNYAIEDNQTTDIIHIPNMKAYRDAALSVLGERQGTTYRRIRPGIVLSPELHHALIINDQVYSFGKDTFENVVELFRKAKEAKAEKTPHDWLHYAQHQIEHIIEDLIHDCISLKKAKTITVPQTPFAGHSASLSNAVDKSNIFHGHTCPGSLYGILGSFFLNESYGKDTYQSVYDTADTIIVQSPGDSCMVDGVLSEMLGFCLDDRMVLGENLIIKRSTRDQPRYVAIGSEEYGGFAAYVNPEITQKVANELLAYKDTLTGAQFIDKAEELSKKLLKNPNDIITVSTLHHNQFKEMASYIHHHH